MKQVILMRTDLGMSTGKMCAQAAHAVLKQNAAVVVLRVGSEEALLAYLAKAKAADLPYRSVRDAGETEVPPGTLTCGCIMGDDREVNKITGQLKLL